MALTILYRGSLASCNYGCDYCPFAKQKDSKAELAQDKAELQRFIHWVSQQNRQVKILFTPWGEALIRGYYRQAIQQLSKLPQVEKVVIQTNFSCSTAWLKECDLAKTAFWITYHPTEISLPSFIQKMQQLDKIACSYSVGMVGIKENFNQIQACRKALNSKIYLWINAYKRENDYYNAAEQQFLNQIDRYFDINNQNYPSFNKACYSGESAISVNGAGDITRCHFIKDKIANIYQADFETYLKPRLCSKQSCGCYIGYMHLVELNLTKIYGNQLLERMAK